MIKIRDILKELEDLDLGDNPLTPRRGSSIAKKIDSNLNKVLKPISLKAGKHSIKGNGILINLHNTDSKELNSFRSTIQELEKLYKNYQNYGTNSSTQFLTTLNKIENTITKIEQNEYLSFLKDAVDFTFDEFAVLLNPKLDMSESGDILFYVDLNPKFVVKGHDKEDNDYMYITEPYERTNPILITPEAKVKLPIDFEFHANKKNVTYKKTLAKLFPDKFGSEYEKPEVNIRDLIKSQGEEVHIDFGKRIRRGGIGIKGNYQDLKKYLTPTSQQNLIDNAKANNITWDDMIIYREGLDTLFSVLGTDDRGRQWMYDRAGHGQGSYSKLRGPLVKK